MVFVLLVPVEHSGARAALLGCGCWTPEERFQPRVIGSGAAGASSCGALGAAGGEAALRARPRVLSVPRVPLLSVASCGWHRFLKTCTLRSVDNHVFLLLVSRNLYRFKRKCGRGYLGALGAPLPRCAVCRVLRQFFLQLLVGRKGDGISVAVFLPAFSSRGARVP